MTRKTLVPLTALALLAAAGAAVAQDELPMAGGAAYARNLQFVGGRAVELAEAIPEDDYGWRPMEGVRSVSEAVMHMASANYFFAGQLGVPVPEGVDPQSMESITDKAQCIETLKASIAQLDKAFNGITDTRAAADIFGRPGIVEDLMLVAIGHVHEHFGQLIAYARSNGVVPPWSRQEG